MLPLFFHNKISKLVIPFIKSLILSFLISVHFILTKYHSPQKIRASYLNHTQTFMETNNYNEPYCELAPENYPLQLNQSKYRPKQLFCKGTLPSADKIGIAIVGTRRPSASAEELCRRLVASLQHTNAVVVSGLAQGIDSYCLCQENAAASANELAENVLKEANEKAEFNALEADKHASEALLSAYMQFGVRK